jgi:hypothetical protein
VLPAVTPAVIRFLAARDAVLFAESSFTQLNVADIRAPLKYLLVLTGLAS